MSKSVTVSIWGMDTHGRPFTESAKTVQLAERALELETPRQIANGEVIGLGFKGQKSRFRAINSFIARKDTYRVTLEDLGSACMWREEMAVPDVVVARGERRRQRRFPIVGEATILSESGSSSTHKLTDISEGGCYIETYAPAVPGSELVVRLSLNKVSVNARGVVRTAHPSIGMGMEIVAFADPADQQRFQQVIEAVSAAS